MFRKICPIVLTLAAFFCVAGVAQRQGGPPTISIDEALDRAVKLNDLAHGRHPFHAVLDISGPAPLYSGRIDLLWFAPSQYRLTIESQGFHQLRIKNEDRIFEQNEGDFYPRWLENFENALLNPLFVESNFRGRRGGVAVGPSMRSCIKRDDGTNGISDEMTWSQICFEGVDSQLSSVMTFNYSMEYADFQKFGNQQIARTYRTDVLDFKPVTAHLSTLEVVRKPDLTQLEIAQPTPSSGLIATSFVSTLREESLIDHPPAFDWPPVHGGKPKAT